MGNPSVLPRGKNRTFTSLNLQSSKKSHPGDPALRSVRRYYRGSLCIPKRPCSTKQGQVKNPPLGEKKDELNTEEYIESGEMEMCLMGAAPEKESDALEEARRESPEIEAEAFKTEIVLEDLALAHRLAPNPWLKHRLFGGINWPHTFTF